MTDEAHAAKKGRQHTVYLLANGDRVPGVTTITGVMDKPALIRWANGLGLRGIDSTKYVDEMATIGTLAHAIIEAHIKGVKMDYSDATPNQISLAENSALKFFEWIKGKKIEWIFSEKSLVSEKHRYGGTIDAYATVDGKKTLLDFKTCKGIYGEARTQVAGGYGLLLAEHGYAVDQVWILRIGRDETEGFEVVQIGNRADHEKRFLICRDLYEINKVCK